MSIQETDSTELSLRSQSFSGAVSPALMLAEGFAGEARSLGFGAVGEFHPARCTTINDGGDTEVIRVYAHGGGRFIRKGGLLLLARSQGPLLLEAKLAFSWRPVSGHEIPGGASGEYWIMPDDSKVFTGSCAVRGVGALVSFIDTLLANGEFITPVRLEHVDQGLFLATSSDRQRLARLHRSLSMQPNNRDSLGDALTRLHRTRLARLPHWVQIMTLETAPEPVSPSLLCYPILRTLKGSSS